MSTIFGKSLCGPDFSFRLEDYGYTVRPAVVPLNGTNDTVTSRLPFNTTIAPLIQTTAPYFESSSYRGILKNLFKLLPLFKKKFFEI